MTRRAIALVYGLACHGLFAVGVGAMVVGLYTGLASGRGSLSGGWAWAVNTLLALQFPLVHSLLLARPGARLLHRLAPGTLGRDLSTTTYAAVASLQLILTFLLWSPSGVVWWSPQGGARVALTLLYAGSWLFLAKALWDAGLALQTGYLGWSAVVRGRRPEFGPMPVGGLFRHSRQPVYVGFALTLWTGPDWTPDRLLLALAWTLYCLVGPRLKEARYLEAYGDAFRRYRERVPYWLPALSSRVPDDERHGQ